MTLSDNSWDPPQVSGSKHVSHLPDPWWCQSKAVWNIVTKSTMKSWDTWARQMIYDYSPLLWVISQHTLHGKIQQQAINTWGQNIILKWFFFTSVSKDLTIFYNTVILFNFSAWALRLQYPYVMTSVICLKHY